MAVDPDLRRNNHSAMHDLPRESFWRLMEVALPRLLRYQLGWWRESISGKEWLAPISVHVAIILILAAALGSTTAVHVWVAYWLGPMITWLPLIRFLSEAGEHLYANAENVFDATVSNIGAFHRFLHPHGDGYHSLHHIRPNTPFHALRRAHETLMSSDPTYRARLKYRMRILEKATTEVENTAQ